MSLNRLPRATLTWLPALALLPLMLLGSAGWAKSEPRTSVADLRYGAALYAYYQQDYVSALSELMVADARDGIQGHGDNPELIAGGISLAFGMEAHAENVFRDILQDDSRPQSVRDAAWFYLGKLQYLRGEWALAQQSFARVSPAFKPVLRAQLEALQINIAIHSAGPDRGTLDGYTPAQLSKSALGDWGPYALYNLGAAQARAGDFVRAQDFFTALARWPLSDNPRRRREQWALLDRAHTALGYSYIARQSYSAAIAEFTQVRRAGLSANQALLGYGMAAAAQADYTKALKPWQLLSRGNLTSPDVQEALLALPYAYQKLSAPGEALGAYQTAEQQLQQQLDTVKDMRATLTRDQLLYLVASEPVSTATLKAWSRQAADDGPGTIAAAITDDGQNWLKLDQTSIIKTRSAYMNELFARSDFQAAVLQLRDLLRLRELLRTWQPKLEIYQDLLRDKQAARNRRAQELATSQLDQRLTGLTRERDQLQAQLAQIEADSDYIALADPDSAKLYERVVSARARLTRLAAAGQGSSEQAERLRLFDGILRWRAAEQFPGQLADAQAQLAEVDHSLAQLQATGARVETLLATSVDIQPRLVRLQLLARDTQTQLARTDALIDRQAQVLQQQVERELSARAERLGNYLAQAQLGAARLYDLQLRNQTP